MNCPNCGHKFASVKKARKASTRIPYSCNAGAIRFTPKQWRALNYWPTGVNPDWIDHDAIARASLVEATAVEDRYASDRNRLSLCACGHDGLCHNKDELDNLLKCEAMGCDCDHFHYAELERRELNATSNTMA